MVPPSMLDIEASGFGKDSYPIEVGYVDRAGKPWCSLVRPCENWQHWSDVAEKLHQIPRNLLFERGKDVKEIATHLNQAFANQTVYTDGWLHDYTWLNNLFEAADITPLFKLEDLALVLSPYQKSVWHDAKQSILNELQMTRHRASADARVLQLTWIKTAEGELAVNV